MAIDKRVKNNFDQENLFQVKQGGSFTIPTTVTLSSPTDGFLGTTKLQSTRAAVGGQILMQFGDYADGAPPDAAIFAVVRPGDVVACSAVAANKITVTVNGEIVGVISGLTTVGGVIGFWS